MSIRHLSALVTPRGRKSLRIPLPSGPQTKGKLVSVGQMFPRVESEEINCAIGFLALGVLVEWEVAGLPSGKVKHLRAQVLKRVSFAFREHLACVEIHLAVTAGRC